MMILEYIRREGLVKTRQAHRRPAGRPACRRSPPTVSLNPFAASVGMWSLGVRPDQDAKAMRDHMLDTSNVIVRVVLADRLVMCPPSVILDEHMNRSGRHGRRGGRLMKFGLFYEHQMGRPWDDGSELRLIQNALEQVEFADSLGIQYVWEVEHHFLEEYSHSSAPEVFLAACSQRTKNMRLGHGIILTAPQFNHPARTAERVSMLDLVSNGRVEFGSGESSQRSRTGRLRC